MTGRGYYFWNNDIRTDIDAEQFEKLCSKALGEENINIRLPMELRAIRYYKEKFFARFCDNYWVVTLNAYYHSMYLNIINSYPVTYIRAGILQGWKMYVIGHCVLMS